MAKKIPKATQRNIRGGGTIRLEMDQRGAKEVLRSGDVGDYVERATAEILLPIVQGMSHRGAVWRINRFVGKDRYRVHLATGNMEARLEEAEYRTLTRAIGLVAPTVKKARKPSKGKKR